MSGPTVDSSSSSDSSDDEDQQVYSDQRDAAFYSIEEFIKQRRAQDNIYINDLRKLPELLREVTPERRAKAQKQIVTYLDRCPPSKTWFTPLFLRQNLLQYIETTLRSSVDG